MKNEIMVKVCERCGVVNTEKAEECEGCGAKLGDAIKNSEAKKHIKQIAKRNAKTKETIANEKFGGMEEDIPEIPVTPARIVIGIFGCLVVLGLAVITVLLGIYNPYEIGYSIMPFNLIIFLMMAISIFTCFTPSKMWALSHWNYQMRYDRMPEPSDVGLVFQVIGCALLDLIGLAVFVVELLVVLGVF